MRAMIGAEVGGVNSPGAIRMAVIAFLSYNLSMASMFGPFGVLIAAIENRLHVSREISTLAVPVVTFGIALLAPLIGSITNRVSLRLLLMAGSLLSASGFALLAIAHSVPVFIGAYGLLVGPGLCIAGVVVPPTLVTRWFQFHRGRALGIVTTPALLAATPLTTALLLRHFGLSTAYLQLSALMLVNLAISAFVVDYPPGYEAQSSIANSGSETGATSGLSMLQLLSDSRFWRLALAFGIYSAIIITFATDLVPLASSRGMDRTDAAALLTIYLVGSIVGTPLAGWVADRIGGARAIGLLCSICAIWQLLIVAHPAQGFLFAIVAFVGLQGAAMPACLGLALSELFGPSGFAKAWGTSNIISLPFVVLAVPVASGIFVRTHSYDSAFILSAVTLSIGAALALSVRRTRLTLPATAH